MIAGRAQEASFKEAFFAHTSTSPNLQLIASLDVARRQAELEGYELVGRWMNYPLILRREVNKHPLISKYFRIATNAQMVPAEYRASGFEDFHADGVSWKTIYDAWATDEFVSDPTRITLLCGSAGFDGTQFKGLLASQHDIQINKTSRNSVLLQTNINNTRSDLAYIIKVLADMARELERQALELVATSERHSTNASRAWLRTCRTCPTSAASTTPSATIRRARPRKAHMRRAYLHGLRRCQLRARQAVPAKTSTTRLKSGPELVSANFVIPYPPGFPIMVPGQVISPEIIEFMRKLDVKEIHGYQASLGLELLKPARLSKAKTKRGSLIRSQAAT